MISGARYGRRATWIGANGDQTFMRIDESLINAHILAASKVFANQTSIGKLGILSFFPLLFICYATLKLPIKTPKNLHGKHQVLINI
jgi:E3 ubiquitin-protein ligase MYCBP2